MVDKFVRTLVILAMPFFLGFAVITLVVDDAYPRYEYGKASFPADPYGFTQAERLDLALVAVGYLERSEPPEEVIYLLEEQMLPGTADPLYNAREIQHMLDVKVLTDAIKRLMGVEGVIVLLGVAWLMRRPATRPQGWQALQVGGLLTVALLVAIGLFIVVAWDIFFVQFHQLLFPPETWTFSYSDSLIRLFPEKFWFDIGVLMSGGTLAAGAVVYAIGRWGRQWRP